MKISMFDDSVKKAVQTLRIGNKHIPVFPFSPQNKMQKFLVLLKM